MPEKIAAIDCGEAHCCVRRRHTAKIYCWGRNDNGQLGTAPVSEAMPVTGIPDVPPVYPGYDLQKSMAVGGYHTCALGNDGEVYCFGANYSYQLGYEGATPPEPVVKVPLPKRAVAVYAGYYSSCALLEDDQIQCWGANIADPTAYWTPKASPSLLFAEPLEKLALGSDSHFALLPDGTLLSWGGSYYVLSREPLPMYEPTACCTDL
jgi:alpha-tubulin suppressor-like RCC1 family protein